MRVCDYRYNEQLIKIKQLEAELLEAELQAKTSGGGNDYEDLKALLKSAVEADNGDNKDGNNKFTIRSAGHCSETVQRELTYGLFQDATLGLVDFMDVDETELYRKMSEGISGMQEEINTNGTLDDKECFKYVAECEAGCDPPEKVFQFGWKRDCDRMTKELLAGLSVCLSVCTCVCVCVCVYHGIQLV